MRGLFITGTDTGVGKTHVASAIVRRLRQVGVRVGAYKPVASGAENDAGKTTWADVERLRAALAGEFPAERICPQRFVAPLAPPVAARYEGRTVDSTLLRDGALWWREHADLLVVEGAGGLLSPLTDTETNADLAVDLGFPLLVVARQTLGTINHTLLTLEAACRRKLAVAGLILNDAVRPPVDDLSIASNALELQRRTSVRILAELGHAPADDLAADPVFCKIDFDACARSSRA